MQLLRLRAIFPIVPMSDSASSFGGMWKTPELRVHQVVFAAHLRVFCTGDCSLGGEEKPTGGEMKLDGRAPDQSFESREIAVGGDPFTTSFDRQRRIPCILSQISGSVRSPAQVAIDVPVPIAWLNELTVGLFQQHRCEGDRVRQMAGPREDAGMSGNADDAR